MLYISKTFEWDMGHRIPDHNNLCKNPHGHRYLLKVNISGKIVTKEGSPEQGMVVDFSKIKTRINNSIIEKLDHAFMYSETDKIMRKFFNENNSLKGLEVPFIPTAESIVEYLKNLINKELVEIDKELRLHSLELNETPKSSATWTR